MPSSLRKQPLASVALPILFIMAQSGIAWAQAAPPAATPAKPSGPAVELPSATIVPLFNNFVKTCAEGMTANSKFASYYCPCAAAFIVDRFSVDELNDEKNSTKDGLELSHPGTTARLTVCALAAKQQDAK